MRSKVQITETVVYEIEVDHHDGAENDDIEALATSEFIETEDKNQYLLSVEERLASVVSI